MGNQGPFVIARDHEHRHTAVRDPLQRLESLMDQAGGDPRSMEHVPTVHDQVRLTGKGGLQGPVVVGKEVLSPAPAANSRPQREIEAEMRIGKKENAKEHRDRTTGWGFIDL